MHIWAPHGVLEHKIRLFKGSSLVKSSIDASFKLCPLVKLFLTPTIPTIQGTSQPTIDYVLANFDASACIECCQVQEDSDLNTSHHLPLLVTLYCSIHTQFVKDCNWVRNDWANAGESEAMLMFQRLKPYIQRSKGNIDHINREIEHVAWLITCSTEDLTTPETIEGLQIQRQDTIPTVYRKQRSMESVVWGKRTSYWPFVEAKYAL